MDEEGIVYLAFSLIILLAAFAATPRIGGGVVTILAALVIVATGIIIVLLSFADYLAVSMGFKLLGITFEPANGYTINKEQKAVLKKVGGIYYATGFISANLFSYEFKQEIGEEDTQMKMVEAPQKWELAVTNINFPFKYHVLASGLSVQNVRDELEGKRSYEEYQLSRVLQDSSGKDVAITAIQRKINVLQRKMDRISAGEKPVGSLMYIETTAIGISEKAAVDELERQVSSLQIALSTMNIDLQRVIGRELYTLFRFNFSVPLVYEEMRGYFDHQG